jgi:hypothetical protein
MHYMQHEFQQAHGLNDDNDSNAVILPQLSADAVLDDKVLEDVKKAWLRITAEDESTFMRFEAREGLSGDDDAM